jgi:hypothetical protein
MRGIISGKKGEGDVVTAFAPTPGQPAPRSTGRPTQPGTNTPAPGTILVPPRSSRLEDADAAVSGSGGITKFPADLDTKQPTWMQIQSFKRTGVSIGSKMAEADFVPTPVGYTEMVCLPIPSGVATNYGHSWDQSDVSVVDEFAMNQGLAKNLRGAADFMVGTTTTQDEYGRNRTDLASATPMADMGVIEGFLSGITKEAVGTIGLIAAGQVLGGATQQATGKAAFNEQVVHYSGPAFRSFEFSFSLKPMSISDQVSIDNIIKFFKIGSMPDLLDSGGIGRVYELPLFFKITFQGQFGELEYMNKIAFCALTGFNVKYGGDRFQTFAANSAPVQTDISMSFKEISLLNKAAAQQGY